MENTTYSSPQPSQSKRTVSLDLRLLTVILLVVIAAMLLAWKPWSQQSTSDRTVEVTGEAIIREKPDAFVFYPSYEFNNADKDAAIAELTKKSNELIAQLKGLGVAEDKIKTNANTWSQPLPVAGDPERLAYNLQLTITTDSQDKAQKIQDFLVTTHPAGPLTPMASFSDSRRKALEQKARDEASKDARKKADEMAGNLGFKVGKVKSIHDGSGFDAIPYTGRDAAVDMGAKATSTMSTMAAPALTVQPGENELRYNITVSYFIR